MRCLIFAGETLVQHVHNSTGAGDTLHPARDFDALRSAVQQCPWDLIIVDAALVPPINKREATFAASIVALGGGPLRASNDAGIGMSTHVAVHVPPGAHATRIAIELARAGAEHFVVVGADDMPDPVAPWRSIVESVASGTLAVQLCRRLTDVIAPFPERLRAAIVTMCGVPGAVTSLPELAQSASLAPRSMHRAIHGSELVSLNLFLQASLLLHAWPALRNPLHSHTAAARASGLTKYQTETYPVTFTGNSLAELRTHWPSDAAILDAIEQRLRIQRTAAARQYA